MGDTENNITGRSPPASGFEDSDARPPRASLIQLSYDSASHCVLAHLVPAPDASVVTLEGLRHQLAEESYDRYFAPDETLQPIVLKANKAETGEYTVAERRDARYDWRISKEKDAVFVTVTRAYGGDSPTRQSLRQALIELKVPDPCILSAALDEVVAMGQGENVCVAKALPAEPGRDTRFEPLVETCRELNLSEDERGRVDMHQLHEFVVVEPGTPLMRRHAATAGKPGLNVIGEPLKPKPGKDFGYGKDIEGAQVSPEDGDLLIAAIKGHPVEVAHGMRVDPTLIVKDVDLSTGNIDFDGSLEVTGDVTSGFVVRASGDIVIRGMVEKAEVHARKNLVVAGGVIGEDLGRDNQNHLQLRTQLRAGGDLSAKFVNLADLVAGGNIQVREYVMQSHLHSQGSILVGQAGGKGCLIGGRAFAAQRLIANILGSDASVYTEIRIGKANPKRRLMEALKQAVLLCEHNCQKLQPVLDAIEQAGVQGPAPEKLEKIRNTLDAQRQRRQRLLSLIQRLTARQEASQDALVDVKRQLHANVNITIDGVSHTYANDMGPRCLVRRGAELVSKS
ncbi:DUF342 domain-containing protein [Marinimicrobium sp. ABcell2]|uniref:DUF342 domain-containing protein n=1 Tax=Marinimicrobium sp. ABcell2 TaxID=3069751 RepID=UPI0027B3545E|nr:FapA family protein [Marinimicrobium sp. ABcell2]MDQ2078131.1 FapA family protein [Marinimicrobium sp. ABcell2]